MVIEEIPVDLMRLKRCHEFQNHLVLHDRRRILLVAVRNERTPFGAFGLLHTVAVAKVVVLHGSILQAKARGAT